MIDYMKLRAAARLRAEGVPTNRIREAVEYLERMETDWHLLPLRAEGKSVLARLNLGLRVVADRGGQIPLDEGLKKTFRKTLRAIRAEGPLGELSDFSNAIDMNPRVRGGAPVIRRTRIETAFISSLHHEMGRKPAAIAVAYQLSELFVRRAVEFEEAAA